MSAEYPLLDPEVTADAAKYQEVASIYHFTMEGFVVFCNDTLKNIENGVVTDVFDDTNQAYFALVELSGMQRSMQNLRKKHGFRIGDEDGSIQTGTIDIFDPHKHGPFLRRSSSEPLPWYVEVNSPLVEVREGNQWVIAAEPKIDEAITPPFKTNRPITRKRRFLRQSR